MFPVSFERFEKNQGQYLIINRAFLTFNQASLLALLMFLTPGGRSRLTDYFLTWSVEFLTETGTEMVERDLGRKELLDQIQKDALGQKKKVMFWS